MSSMNEVNPFPALTAPHSLDFLSNLADTDQVALVVNFGNISLAKGTARPFCAFLPKLSIILPRNLPD